MTTQPVRSQVLTEAEALVNGDRQADYGPPEVNFQRIATMWQVLFPERQWTPADAALAMAAVKLARAVQSPKRDTAVDLAGYAALWAELTEGDQWIITSSPRHLLTTEEAKRIAADLRDGTLVPTIAGEILDERGNVIAHASKVTR